MTTYFEFAAPGTGNSANWDDPTVWNPQAVPESTDDGVILSQITVNGQPAPYTITIKADEGFSINSLQVPANFLALEGTLSVVNNVNVGSNGEIDMRGGSLSAGHIVVNGFGLQGVGTVASSGGLEVQSEVASITASASTSLTQLTVAGATFYNSGTLVATPGSTLLAEATQPGGFLNFNGGDLSGGIYQADSGATLDLKTNGVVTRDDATLVFSGSNAVIASYNPTNGEYIPLQVSLASVGASGKLLLLGAPFDSPYFFKVDGTVQIEGSGLLGSHGLNIDPGGVITYTGSESQSAISVDLGFIQDNGVITAVAADGASTSMTIQPIVRGTGSVVVGPEVTFTLAGHAIVSTVSIDLQGPVSTKVDFSDDTGTVILGLPTQFTGTFGGFVKGDSIVLSGVSLSSVTGFSYSGGTTSGVLTVQEGGTALNLAFSGDYTTQSFALSAGTQSSPSVVISDTGATEHSAAVHTVASSSDHVPLIGMAAPMTANISG